MKKLRFGVLLLCLALSFSFLHSTAAAYDKEIPLTVQYAEELSEYTTLAYYKAENAALYVDFKMRFPDCSWETIITDVNIGLDNDYYTNAAEIKNPGSADVLVNKYNYLPRDFVPEKLETINPSYCFKTEKLTHEARLAFEKMCADARALGYRLYATSSYRSYYRQRDIYNTVGIPDVTAARPGYSEHQTGLAVDVIHATVASNSGLTKSAVYKWYVENACNYGFIIRYKEGWEFLTGYAAEPWHLRYLGTELATAVKNSNLTYDEYYTRYIGIPENSGSDGETVDEIMRDAVGITAEAFVSAGDTVYSLAAFNVLGDTFFKLRDIAIILSGTAYEFDVSWDAEKNEIILVLGSAYSSEPALSELESGQITHMTAAMPPLNIDEQAYELGAFMVAGSNYYTLEALGELLGFTASEDDDGILTVEAIAEVEDTPDTDPADDEVIPDSQLPAA